MYHCASTTTTNKSKKGNNNGNGHTKRSSSSSSSSSGNNNNNNNNNNKGVMRLSTDPQSVAARERRHRISDRFKILQGLVPGGTKMDTVSMLEQAIHYVKFLKAQIWLHQNMIIMNHNNHDHTMSFAPPDYCGTSTTTNESSTLYYHNDYGSSSNLAFDEPNQVPFELPHQYRSCLPSHETASFDPGNMRM